MAILGVLPGALAVDHSLVLEGENTLSIRIEATDGGTLSPGWSLTAVVLLVVEGSELEAVVAAADQLSSTAGVAIVDAAV